jgi:hypothetical protein
VFFSISDCLQAVRYGIFFMRSPHVPPLEF